MSLSYEKLMTSAKAAFDAKAESASSVRVAEHDATSVKDCFDLLLYQALKKELENSKRTIELDADCKISRTNASNKEQSFAYYHVISTENTHKNAFQLKHKVIRNQLHFNTSYALRDAINDAISNSTNDAIKQNVHTDDDKRKKNCKVSCTVETVAATLKLLEAVKRANTSAKKDEQSKSKSAKKDEQSKSKSAKKDAQSAKKDAQSAKKEA